MDSSTTSPPAIGSHTWPVQRMLGWCLMVSGMFRRAPVRFYLLPLIPLLGEGMIQLVPVVGVVMSKFTVPWLSAWVLLMGHGKLQTGRFAPRGSATELMHRPAAMIVVALLSVGVFAFQCLVMGVLAGPAKSLALAGGDIAGLGVDRLLLAVVLGSGMIPSVFLMFSIPRMVLDGLSAGAALRENIQLLRLGWRPILGYAVMSLGVVSGFVFWPVLLLLLPGISWIGYAAYADAYGCKPAFTT